MMGGSYGYNIGYVSNGRYQTTKNLRRSTFAILADAPAAASPYHSLNHEGRGQNVLFEDVHVQYLTTCKAHGCSDNIFVNDDGKRAPGLHRNDAVIGRQRAASPLDPGVKDAGTSRTGSGSLVSHRQVRLASAPRGVCVSAHRHLPRRPSAGCPDATTWQSRLATR